MTQFSATDNQAAPIRILHVLGVLNMGGAESRIMDLYRHVDRSRVQFDFLVHTAQKGDAADSDSLMAERAKEYFDDEIRSLGGRIYALPRFNGKNFVAYRKAIRAFFASHGGWTAVEGHMTSTASVYLPIAESSGVPVTIAHVRSAGVDAGLRGAATRLLRASLPRRAQYLLACGRDAGLSAYGKKEMESGRVRIVPNALEIGAYRYDERVRREERRRLGLPETAFVIGHVGRFDAMKNHAFLVELLRLLDGGKGGDFYLLMIGKGSLEEEIRGRLAAAGLSDRAVFAGQCPREETARLYQAMDCFCFPSLYEGVPGTVVEAQAAGLPCLMSDRVTDEVCVSPLVERLPLASAGVWESRVRELRAQRQIQTQGQEEADAPGAGEHGAADVSADRISGRSVGDSPEGGRAAASCGAIAALRDAGFDIESQAVQMEQWYLSLAERKKKLLLISPMLHQGGFERVCVRTARLLEPYYEITIVIFDDADIAYDIEGLHVVNLDLGSRPGRIGKLVNLWRRVRRVRALKRELGIDVTYSFGQTANLVNSYAKEKDKTICSLRSYLDLDNPEKISLFCRRADWIACCSAQIEEEIRTKYGCDRTFTLYNPIRMPEEGAAGGGSLEEVSGEGTAGRKSPKKASESAAAQPAGEQDWGLPPETAAQWEVFAASHGTLVMSMGREDDVKGFWHLLKAFSLLRGEWGVAKGANGSGADRSPEPGTEASQVRPGLVIIGEGDFAEYRVLAERLGVGDDVLFTGVSRNPSEILKRARLYVLASIHEGFPNALLEAMALGVPVIATDCKTGPAEILRGKEASGVLIPPLSPEKNLDASRIPREDRSLAREMKRLLSNEALWTAYSEGARRRARDFSEEAYVAQCRERF
ncbi:MAG: glycosyltransferase [Eubacteriales bacterium]|nr:glycosyltransferase [Eubacteriales bacterium]